MSQRSLSRTIWVVAALAIAACLYGLWRELEAGVPDEGVVFTLTAIAWSLLPMAFILTGALILSRQPGNVVGLLLMLPAVPFVLVDAVFDIPPEAPTALDPLLWLQLWFDNWSWVLLIFPVFHLLLVFPTGRLLSRRWRWVVGLELAMAAFMVFGAAFGAEIGPLNMEGDLAWMIANPIGFLPAEVFGSVFGAVWSVALLFMTVASVTAVVLRYRRGGTVERQQIKWLMFAVSMFGLVYGTAAITSNEFTAGSLGDLLFALTLIGIPVSIGVAVLRYRLFDIDLLIRKTLLYVVLTGLLVGVYLLSVFVLQNLVRGLAGEESPLVVAGSTLLIAALFNPSRRRLQALIDRRLYRSKYDSQRIIDAFAVSARDEADMGRLSSSLLDLVEEAVRPTVKGLWVRGTGTAGS